MKLGARRPDRLLAHLRDCVAVAERVATPEQHVAAEMHLASLAPSPQGSLFNTAPPTRESCPEDVPSLLAGRRGPFVGQ